MTLLEKLEWVLLYGRFSFDSDRPSVCISRLELTEDYGPFKKGSIVRKVSIVPADDRGGKIERVGDTVEEALDQLRDFLVSRTVRRTKQHREDAEKAMTRLNDELTNIRDMEASWPSTPSDNK
jgi:hypothetical protein